MNLQTEVPALPVLVPLVLILITAGVFRLHRTGRLTAMRTFTVVAATIYLAAVLRLTTLPLQISLGKYANTVSWYEKLNWIPLFIDPRTFVLNIIMTVPLGIMLPLLTPIRASGRSRWPALPSAPRSRSSSSAPTCS